MSTITYGPVDALPVSAHVIRELQRLADEDTIAGVLVDAGQDPVKVHAWGSGCVDKRLEHALRALPSATHGWVVGAGPGLVRATRPGSRTDMALRILETSPETTPYVAARRAGVDPAAVYRALQRGKTRCPCCGKPA